MIGLIDVSLMTPAQKDVFWIEHILLTLSTAESVVKIVDIIEKLPGHADYKKELNKKIKEIEDTISSGIPGWIKYTRKTKKNK